MKRFSFRLIKIGILFFCILLLFFPNSSLNGAKSGLLMWFHTVLPTLFPFIFITGWMRSLGITDTIGKFFQPVLGRIFHVSSVGTFVILIGFLSGFPTGAKLCADLTRMGKISKKEGQFLLSFCNNASPMFILSYLSISSLNQAEYRFYYLFIIYASALISGFLFLKNHTVYAESFSTPCHTTSTKKKSLFSSLDESIMNSFEIVTKVGGYIILFSIIAEIISDRNFIPEYGKLISISLLEMTTGIQYICSNPFSTMTQMVLVCTITAFGGLSGLAQTKSVIDGSGLSIRRYFLAKIINGTTAFVLSTFFALIKIFNIF